MLLLEHRPLFLTQAAPRGWQACCTGLAFVFLLLQLWYVLWLMTFDLSTLSSSAQAELLHAVQYMQLQQVVSLEQFWQLPPMTAIAQVSPLVFWNGFALFSLLLFVAGLWLLQRTLLRIHTDYLPACFFLMGVLHWLAAWAVLQQLQTAALAGPLSSLGVMGLGYFLLAGLVVQLLNLRQPPMPASQP